MDITKTDTKLLKVADLRPNEGQIPDVPSNPRFITESEYEKLCNSLREDNLTGVLQVKVYNYQGEWIVLDGNMRLKAMQEVGIQEAQCLVVPQDAPAAVLRKIVIEANSTFGDWDMDALANEWDAKELDAWGVDVPAFDETPEYEGGGGQAADNFKYESQYGVIVMCSSEEEQEQVYNKLTKDGYSCKVVSV